MFIHHVFFWMKNDYNPTDYSNLLAGITTLKAIEPKLFFHVGIPATTSRDVIDSSYTFSLLITFDNLKDQETYQIHPIHLNFVANCAKLWEKVVVYDTIGKQ